jgi:molybdenum-dependent DNA-binding transcriptional regulator ModE
MVLDLFTLLHRRMGDGGARAELLQHIAVQGALAVAAAGGQISFKVVADFDDTLRQGWVDKRVPRRA